MPFCTSCGSPVGAANRFCVSCGTPVAAAPASSAAPAPAASSSAAPTQTPAGRGLSSNKGTDWLPSTFHSDPAYGGSLAQTEKVLGELLNETNAQFGQLGVSVSASRSPAAGAGPAVECPACFRPIKGAAVQALGRTLHPQCFTCHRCHDPIGDQSFVVRGVNKDQAWCEACVGKEKVSMGGSASQAAGKDVPPFRPAGASSTTTTTTTGGSGLTSSQRNEFLSRRDEGKTYCAECSSVIIGDGVVTPRGTFHEQCFRCTKCGAAIEAGSKYATDGLGRAMHAACSGAASGSGSAAAGASECAKCHKPLSGKFVRDSSGSPFHRDCFLCARCNKDLSAGYAMREGKPHCASCASAATPYISSAPNAAVAAGGVAGIRYNQVTREVTRVGPGATPPSASASAAAPAVAAPKFCTSCGTALGGNKFCSGCGTKA